MINTIPCNKIYLIKESPKIKFNKIVIIFLIINIIIITKKFIINNNIWTTTFSSLIKILLNKINKNFKSLLIANYKKKINQLKRQ